MRQEHEIDPDAWKEWLTETSLEEIKAQVEEVCSYNGAFDGFEYQIAKVCIGDMEDWHVIPLYMLDGTHKAGEICYTKTINGAIKRFISKELEAIERFKG